MKLNFRIWNPNPLNIQSTLGTIRSRKKQGFGNFESKKIPLLAHWSQEERGAESGNQAERGCLGYVRKTWRQMLAREGERG